MASRNETLLNPSFKPSKRRKNNHFFAKTTLATAIALGGVGGAIWVENETRDTQTKPTPTELQEIFPAPPVLTKQEKKAMEKVPLNEITKEKGFLGTTRFDGERSETYPYGFALSLQDMTIIATKDDPNSGIWVALTTGGKKLTETYSTETYKNYDGSKVKEAWYDGFTAWVKFPAYARVFSARSDTLQPLYRSDLKVGNIIGAVVDINNSNKVYSDMNYDNFKKLHENVGLPNDRSDIKLQFLAEFARLTEDNY